MIRWGAGQPLKAPQTDAATCAVTALRPKPSSSRSSSEPADTRFRAKSYLVVESKELPRSGKSRRIRNRSVETRGLHLRQIQVESRTVRRRQHGDRSWGLVRRLRSPLPSRLEVEGEEWWNEIVLRWALFKLKRSTHLVHRRPPEWAPWSPWTRSPARPPRTKWWATRSQRHSGTGAVQKQEACHPHSAEYLKVLELQLPLEKCWYHFMLGFFPTVERLKTTELWNCNNRAWSWASHRHECRSLLTLDMMTLTTRKTVVTRVVSCGGRWI